MGTLPRRSIIIIENKGDRNIEIQNHKYGPRPYLPAKTETPKDSASHDIATINHIPISSSVLHTARLDIKAREKLSCSESKSASHTYHRLLRLPCGVSHLPKLPNSIYRALIVKLKLKLKNRHSSSAGFGRKSKRNER